MDFLQAFLSLYKVAFDNKDFVFNLASFWGAITGLLSFKREATWGDRTSWLVTGYFFSRYGGQVIAYWVPKYEEPIRFFLAMFFSFFVAFLVKIIEYITGDAKLIPAIVIALLPSFIANKLNAKNEPTT